MLVTSMNEQEFKPVVKKIFNQLGFKAKDIQPCDDILSPDFEVTGNNDRYTVELKIKGDDPKEVDAEMQALDRGELVGKSIPVGPRNRLAGIIRKGVKQMVEHDPTDETYRVIWLHSTGEDSELYDTRFRATLFGTESLFSLRLPNIKTCFYFHESAFYSWRKYLDGAMLTYSNHTQIHTQLCINTLSPRVNVFRESELVKSMSNGLCDPDKLHGLDNDILIADCQFDRKDSNKTLVYLQEKYGLDHLQTIPMQKHTGKILYKDG